MLGLFNNHSQINSRKKRTHPPLVYLHVLFFAATSFYAFFVNRKKALTSFVRKLKMLRIKVLKFCTNYIICYVFLLSIHK